MLARIFAFLLSAHLALVPASVYASQNQLSSPTTGTVSGLQLSNNYNNGLDSVNTANSGPSAPTNQLSGVPSLGNWWLNSTSSPYPVQQYDGADWLTPFWIDASNHLPIVQVGGGSAVIASASTTDLCSGAPQYFLSISGTTTITSFGSSCNVGQEKLIEFSGILTLTYNGTSLIIPGAANVITAAGDVAKAVYLGSGNWRITSYTPASGQALLNPSIDVGDYVLTSLLSPPSSKYLLANGQAVSRSTYATLLAGTTITQSVTRTNGSPTLTGFSDTTQIPTGAAIEGSGIATGATILSCASTNCTMSANATSSGTANVTIFLNGNGDGSTTFNLPDCRGVALVGRDNMGGTARGLLTSTYFGVNPDALGAKGGAQSYTFLQGNLPNVNFTVSGTAAGQVTAWAGEIAQGNPGGAQVLPCFSGSACSGTPATTANSSSISGNAASGGSGTPMPTITPSITANCMIRVLARLETVPGEPPRVVAVNDDLPIADRRRAA